MFGRKKRWVSVEAESAGYALALSARILGKAVAVEKLAQGLGARR